MPECAAGDGNPVFGYMWIAIATDVFPTGYLELEVPLCAEHYQVGSGLPANVPVALRTHLS